MTNEFDVLKHMVSEITQAAREAKAAALDDDCSFNVGRVLGYNEVLITIRGIIDTILAPILDKQSDELLEEFGLNYEIEKEFGLL